jgi:excisionase family DNA binding protein
MMIKWCKVLRMTVADPEFMTVAEVAVLLRVAKMTVYRMVHDGELESVRIGRRTIRIRGASVRKLLGQ